MNPRNKFLLWSSIVLVALAAIAFLLGPVLFASIAYPLEKADAIEIDKWTKQYCSGISNADALVAGLIMTESNWRTNAKSGAGAVGLTQFMPATARGVAKQLGVSPFSANDLLSDRNLAIRFGTYYICTRIKDYGGNVTKGLIAYNGGGGAVTAYERGYPIKSTVSYANTIISRQKGYAAVYGGNFEKVLTEATDSSGNTTTEFKVQPKLDLSSLATTSITDFWRGWLSSPKDTSSSTQGGDVNNLWQDLLGN